MYLGGNIYLASSCIAATCGLASCTHVHMLAYTPRHGLPSRSFTRIVALATPCCDTLRTYYHRLGFVGPFVPIHTNPWTPTTYIYIYIYNLLRSRTRRYYRSRTHSSTWLALAAVAFALTVFVYTQYSHAIALASLTRSRTRRDLHSCICNSLHSSCTHTLHLPVELTAAHS